MGSEESVSSSEEESSSSSSRSSKMSETSWDGDPNTPHPDNPYNEGGDIEYARQRVLDSFNSSADEIRPPPFCSVEDTKRKQQEEWDYYQRPTGTSPPHTRGSCIMGIREALHRLTSNDKDKSDEEDEWIVIKVPKREHNTRFSSLTIATGIRKMNCIGWRVLTSKKKSRLLTFWHSGELNLGVQEEGEG